MVVYRIADCRFVADLSGTGAAICGGRWNSKGVYVLYTARSPSLALLESVVHFGKMPALGYCLATIDIPGHSIYKVLPGELPATWQEHPSPDLLKLIGDNFVNSRRHLAMEIPSAIMSDENNYLVNPAHPLFSSVKITSQRPLVVDDRLFPRAIS